MHCPCCMRNRSNKSFACHRCITANLRTFHRKLHEAQQKTAGTAEQVERMLVARPALTLEKAGEVASIVREAAYVRKLVEADQVKLDDLQNRLARQRQALDRARRLLGESDRQAHLVKTQARAKRKEWRMLHDGLVACRQQCVRECLDLFRVRQSRDGLYEVGGRPIPYLLKLHKSTAEDIYYSMERLTALVMLLSAYLSIVLPFQIIPPGPDQPSPRIALQSLEEPVTLSLHMNTLDQGDYLAALLINLRLLANPVVLSAADLGGCLGQWILALTGDTQLGSHSDASALNYIRTKAAVEQVLADWSKRIVEECAVQDAQAWEQVDFADVQ